jgi:hypothetical protein
VAACGAVAAAALLPAQPIAVADADAYADTDTDTDTPIAVPVTTNAA